MADVHSKAVRSHNMSRIRGQNTKPEIIVRKLCHSLGLRFRLHRKDLPGKPDLVFPKHKVALFVHGCFWHSHHCKYGAVRPKSNEEFWNKKRSRTVERDSENQESLHDKGWRVITIWECETKELAVLEDKLRQLFTA
jgi:DNA mismatch endonuclease (patch repair protein)